MIHGPLTGHRSSKNALAENQTQADEGQRDPPDRRGQAWIPPSQTLIHATHEQDQEKGGGQVSRHGG